MRRVRTSQRNFTADQLDPRFKVGCIGHWIGGVSAGGWQDRSPYGNHGTFLGSPKPTLGFNNLRDAVRTAAGTDQVRCGVAPIATDLIALSVAAWVLTTNTGAEQQIVSKLKSDAGAGWVFTIDVGGALSWFVVTVGSAPNTSSTQLLATNQWYHVAYTQTAMVGAIGVLYINGVVAPPAVASNGNSAYPTDATSNLSIAGRDFDASGLIGCVDDVRLFNRTLSAAEIATLASPAFLPVLG